MLSQPTDFLQLLLGAGGVAFLTAVFKAFKEWREGSWRRRDAAVADLERWRDDNDNRRRTAEDERDGWRAYAGDLEHLLRVNGIAVPPGKPVALVQSEDAR